MFTGPLFLVGAPRSGTKLLRDLVKQHPRIGIPDYETEFLPAMVDKAFVGLEEPVAFQAFYLWVTRFLYFKYMEEEGRLIGAEAWRRACRSHDVQGIFEALCRHDAQVPEGGVWGDKSPNYRNHLPLLKELFPDARFVHIVRDVRDVCLSSHKAWGKHLLRNAQRWQDELSACRRAGASLGGDYLELRYEDLLADPERELRRIAALCGLDFDPAMLDPGRASENLGDTRGQRGIVAGNSAKWKERMDPDKQRRIEAMCGPLLAELGYERIFGEQPQERAGRARMLAWQLQDGVALLRFRRKEWGLKEALKRTLSAFESR